jgi:hypothetical protein
MYLQSDLLPWIWKGEPYKMNIESSRSIEDETLSCAETELLE